MPVYSSKDQFERAKAKETPPPDVIAGTRWSKVVWWASLGVCSVVAYHRVFIKDYETQEDHVFSGLQRWHDRVLVRLGLPAPTRRKWEDIVYEQEHPPPPREPKSLML